MRFNINLATQPYQDSARFYLTWLPLLVLLVASAAVSSFYAYHHFADSRSVQRQLSEKQKEVAQLDKELEDARATLDLPQNSGTRDQARFVNELFAHKSFSWTRVVSDLETVMPNGVQVQSIKPETGQDGQTHVLLTVAVERREDAIELVRRMESSPRFVDPVIANERTKKYSKDNRLNVEIVYVPRRSFNG